MARDPRLEAQGALIWNSFVAVAVITGKIKMATSTAFHRALDPVGEVLGIPVVTSRSSADRLLVSIIGHEFWRQTRDPRLQEWYWHTRQHLGLQGG